jgi:hypothetical protein
MLTRATPCEKTNRYADAPPRALLHRPAFLVLLRWIKNRQNPRRIPDPVYRTLGVDLRVRPFTISGKPAGGHAGPPLRP